MGLVHTPCIILQVCYAIAIEYVNTLASMHTDGITTAIIIQQDPRQTIPL